MSLKSFHLFFIGASVVMCLLIGAWGVSGYLEGVNGGRLTLGLTCFVLGFGLVVYGVKVYRKLSELPR